MRKHPLIALVAFAVLATSVFVGAAGAGTFNSVPIRAVAPEQAVIHIKLSRAEVKRDQAKARYDHAVARFVAALEVERRSADWHVFGADVAAVHSESYSHDTALPSAWYRWVRAAAASEAAERAQYFAAVAEAQQEASAAAAQLAASQAAASTVAAPAPAPAPVASSAGDPGGAWLQLRLCESGDNYAEDTGNGYYGAYQFSLATWEGLGYSGLPSDAPPAVQDAAAEKLQAMSGWGQWPACSAELGL